MNSEDEKVGYDATLNKINPTGNIDYTHSGKDIRTVIEDILSVEPEEPFYFLNEGLLRGNIGIFRDHFLPGMEERRIIYAMKANPRKRIMEILTEEGIDGFDCASANEISSALEHVHGPGIYFNSPIKTRKAIAEAHAKGVRYFTVQSENEVLKILESACPSSDSDLTEIAVRLRTLNDEAVINLSIKYGAEKEIVREILKSLKRENGHVIGGLAMNEGSQNTNPMTFAKGIKNMTNIARSVSGVSSINIGGGIPVNYQKSDNFDTREYLRVISQFIRGNIRCVFIPGYENPKIIIEPGRSIVADTIDLTIPVLAAEERDGKRCIYIHDGVFGSFSDFAVHGWQYNFDVIPGDRRDISPNKKPCMVYGNTCDSGDNLGETLLPENIKAGDFLWAKKAGAYMDSQSSRFNGFGPIKYISYNANP
jgi:ornithine decarboxylase